MGKGNVALRQFMKNKKRFADLFNAKVFKGRQVVLPEELEEVDSESDILFEDKEGRPKSAQRYRDVVMRWRGCVNLVILACEHQAKVHYAMPVRNMLYDSLSYAEQIKQLWDSHQGKGDRVTAEEYLSHFRKDDKIFPVITLVWYYGLQEWDGSLDLYGMFPVEEIPELEEVLRSYVSNYRINLIDAENISDIEHFCTDLQLIFGMLQCKSNKKELVNYMNEHGDYFQSVDDETYYAIGELLHSEKMLKQVVKKESGGSRMNACKALEDLYQEGIEQGVERGTIETLQEIGTSKQETVSKVMMKFDLDEKKATSLVEKYWK